MGKNTNQIATEYDLRSYLRDKLWFADSRCPTKSEIVGWGLTVSGTYSNYKCVKWSDISKPSSNTSLTIYYGIYNNKSSSAKLDNIIAYIGHSTSGPWTEIGRSSLGSISSTKTGTISCSIPVSFDLSKQCYIRIYAGATAFKQYWYYKIGNINTLTGTGYTDAIGNHDKAKAANYYCALEDCYRFNWLTSNNEAIMFCIE